VLCRASSFSFLSLVDTSKHYIYLHKEKIHLATLSFFPFLAFFTLLLSVSSDNREKEREGERIMIEKKPFFSLPIVRKNRVRRRKEGQPIIFS